MAHVYGPKSVKVVAAKSLYREELRVVESHGKVQSGLFFVAKNLTEDEIEKVKQRSYAAEGTFSVTCLNATVGILSSIGFKLDGANLADYKFPHAFLHDVLRNGLKPQLNGRTVEFSIVKTTRMSLSEYYDSIVAATASTPIRHLNRAIDTEGAKAERKKISEHITKENEEKLAKLQSSFGDTGPTFTVLVSETSSLGEFFRSVWGTHVIYKVQLTDYPEFIAKLNELLPTTLKEFDRPELDLATRIKKNLLFCESVVDMIRSHMTKSFDKHEGFTQYNLVNMLAPEVDGDERKYNFVVTSKEMILISNSVCYGFVDWILSKHVLISGYSHDVRFAGEMWKDENNTIYLNNNSGTYRPTTEQLEKVVQLAHVLFPNIQVKSGMHDEQPEETPEYIPEDRQEQSEEDEVWGGCGFEPRQLPPEEEVEVVRQALSISRRITSLRTSQKRTIPVTA